MSDEKRGGFHAFVGNPPFAHKNLIFAGQGKEYVYFLCEVFPGAHGSSDLAAYFLRRAFDLLRPGGTAGLIATNTVAQGDTRCTGLGWICTNGGHIYDACKRVRWPGVAAVIVSVVHLRRGVAATPCHLNGKEVDRVSAYLLGTGCDNDPPHLHANAGRAFVGSYILGAGFIFEDGNPGANSIEDLREVVRRDPRNAERVFPFQGGEQINTDPQQALRGHVINFADMTEQEARRWPDLMALLETRVKPTRDKLGDEGDAKRRKAHWWRWGQYSHALFDAVARVPRVLATSQVSTHLAFAFQPSNVVFGHTVVVIALPQDAALALLQSRVHEAWVRFRGSSFKDDPRYTPSDCFETFPFPTNWEPNATLEDAGRVYYEFRAALMVQNDQGLTATYNRFHDPDEHDVGILRLRELHDAMDRAVLDAYGWTDVIPRCEFLLDSEDEAEDDDGRAKKRKKPWRWRWLDEVRDEVLARLLALNAERAEEERLAGAEVKLVQAAKKRRQPTEERAATATKKAKTRTPPTGQGGLFG